MPHRILVVEDDPAIASRVVRGLTAAGFEVELATDGLMGANAARGQSFDLVVLDLMLPELDGFELLERWRGTSSVPVLVLTANADLQSRLRTFDLGAVDFVPKPFWMEEIVARVRARLALRDAVPNRTIVIGSASIDLDARRVVVADEDAGLTAHEFNILACLVERPGRALTRQQLSEMAFEEAGERSDRVIDSHVARVRKKLGDAGKRIATVWGVGYRFDDAKET